MNPPKKTKKKQARLEKDIDVLYYASLPHPSLMSSGNFRTVNGKREELIDVRGQF